MAEKDDNSKLDWMYKGANSLIDREEYLLGRSVDKSLEQLNNQEKDKRLGVVPPKNHVEHECIPPSIRDFNKIIQAEQVDMFAKLQEDPLVAIRKLEEEARRQFLQNPVQLQKFQDALKSQELKKKIKKQKKSMKSDCDEQLRNKLKLLKNGQFPLKSPKKEKNEKKNDNLDTILMHKFNMLKDKLSQKDLDDIMTGKLSDSEEESSRKISKNQGGTSNKKKGEMKSEYKKGKTASSDESDEHRRINAQYNSKHRTSLSSKSERIRKSTSRSPKRNKKKIDTKSDLYHKKNSSSRESRKKRNYSSSSSSSEDRSERKGYSRYTRDRTSSSSSDEESDRSTRRNKRSKKNRNRSSSSSKERIKRKPSNKDVSKHKHKRSSSSDEGSDQFHRRKNKLGRESRKKGNRGEERETRRHISKYGLKKNNSSSDEEEINKTRSKSIREHEKNHSREERKKDYIHKKKYRSNSNTDEDESCNEKKSKSYRGKRSRSSSSSEQNDSDKGDSLSMQESVSNRREARENRRKRSKSSRESKNVRNPSSRSKSGYKGDDINKNKYDDGKKKKQRKEISENSDSSDNDKNVAEIVKNDAKDESISNLDRLILEKLKVFRDSQPAVSSHKEGKLQQKTPHSDSEDEDYAPKKKTFGLVRPDGTKIPLNRTSYEVKTEPVKEVQVIKKPEAKKSKRLTEEEKEELRKQMMADASKREVERSANLKRYRQEEEREQQVSDFDKNFVHKELLKTTKNATMEARLKSNLNNIQRSSQHMNSNFSRR